MSTVDHSWVELRFSSSEYVSHGQLQNVFFAMVVTKKVSSFDNSIQKVCVEWRIFNSLEWSGPVLKLLLAKRWAFNDFMLSAYSRVLWNLGKLFILQLRLELETITWNAVRIKTEAL